MRIVIRLVGVVVAAGLLLAAVPVRAHHSFAAAFDENRPVNLQGTVTKVELVNPHAWIWLDVKGADGKVVNWGIEGGPPTNLLRNGITKASLPVGAEINCSATRPRVESPKASACSWSIWMDGRCSWADLLRAPTGIHADPAPPAV